MAAPIRLRTRDYAFAAELYNVSIASFAHIFLLVIARRIMYSERFFLNDDRQFCHPKNVLKKLVGLVPN